MSDPFHLCYYPVSAPPWAIELKHQGALILAKLEKIMPAIDDLAAAVAAEDTVIGSAVTLLNGIPALIAAAGTDPAKLAALQADIQAQTQTLAQAVVTGTPAASAPSPTTAVKS